MNQTRTVETIGPDIDQAIDAGLKILDVSRESVAVEILEEPSRGLLGIGARQARVRLTTTMPARSEQSSHSISTLLSLEPDEEQDAIMEIQAEAPVAPLVLPSSPPPPPSSPTVNPSPSPAVTEEKEGEEMDEEPLLEVEVQVGVEILKQILSYMDVDAELTVERAYDELISEENPWILHVHGNNLGFLIGRRGETLAALQYLARMIAGRDLEKHPTFVIDVENYKARREVLLRKLAQRMAKEALRRRRRIELEPMPPHERRIIHMTLRDHPQVKTESIGEGNRRRVTIVPKRP